MSTLRTALTMALLVLLCAGYGASQVAYFQGRAAEYAQQVDRPPVRLLAGAALVLCVAFALGRERPKELPGA